MKDFGLFGPGSVTWRIHSHPAGLIGGLRGLMIQALNSRAMKAVADHSSYREDPWGRLRRTSQYLQTTVFGDRDTALRAAARVQRVHRSVHGYDPVSRSTYSAEDPELLLWIHSVEVHSFLTAYRAYARPLSDLDADRYVLEMVRSAELVGLKAHEVPEDLAALRAYLLSVDDLTLTPEAREGLRLLIAPPMPFYFRPLWGVPVAAAVAILPRKVRQLYGLPWFEPARPAVQVSTRALLETIRIVLPPPPPVKAALDYAATGVPPLERRSAQRSA